VLRMLRLGVERWNGWQWGVSGGWVGALCTEYCLGVVLVVDDGRAWVYDTLPN